MNTNNNVAEFNSRMQRMKKELDKKTYLLQIAEEHSRDMEVLVN